METSARLRRVTDLFVEGTEVYLGDDETGNPVVIWVNKLNSFETEEARRDGAARRGLRMSELGKEDNPERMGVLAEVAMWDTDRLAERYVEQKADEIYLDVYNDLQTDPEQRERLEVITRMPKLLDDAGAAPDDPRRAELNEASNLWMQAIDEAQKKAYAKALADAKQEDRETLEKAYLENWRQRETLDVFMQERRTTQLYFALRECLATDVGTTLARVWDHAKCDHSTRLLIDRDEVRTLPEQVIEKAITAIDDITIPQREAGNSDAPASSSDSSEQSRPAEGTSKDSAPEGASSGPPTS